MSVLDEAAQVPYGFGGADQDKRKDVLGLIELVPPGEV